MPNLRSDLRRLATFEVVEPRCLMAGDLTLDSAVSANLGSSPIYLKVTAETRASDLNMDGVINHRDAHAVVSFLNARATEGVPSVEGESSSTPNMDINGDSEVGPLDVLWIVNQINDYDPLTPCGCGACSQPTTEGRCENASLAQTQAASSRVADSLSPAGEFSATQFPADQLMDLAAWQSLGEPLRKSGR